ncbi:MiaB/RimO family radical SAM methylthiotransferase, partial [Muricomes intestini]
VQTQEVPDPCIDVVIGNNKKQDLLSILEEYDKDTLIDINNTKEYENLHLSRTGEHTRAYIKVQDGCNQFCSYCIIPYARGRVRSRVKEDVIEEVKRLAQNGYQEVVLTGIHLSSYGIDFEEGEENLLSLIQAVHDVEGIRRIRLGSLEPRIITEEFARTISALPKMCPHFHLSLQSGCDAVLKRMNRRYTSGEYYEKCALLRKYFENPALTTDVIVGFPGETNEEFGESKAFIEKVEFYEAHVFKYSKRQGTKAAVMEEQIPEQIKSKRSDILLALNEEGRQAYEKNFVGKEVEVLVEESVEIGGETMQIGHTREYMKVAVKTKENLQNHIVKVQIENDLQIIH